MASIHLLGVFEDAAQRDFHAGIVGRWAQDHGVEVRIEPRLTHGCRFDFLAEFLRGAQLYSGTLVAVDGKKLGEEKKVEYLSKGLGQWQVEDLPEPLLWSVANPSIEEWMMADAQAVEQALKRELGLQKIQHATRPGGASAERTAKRRLAEWTSELVGTRLLQGGREYAESIGWHVDSNRIGVSRNADLKTLIEEKLPDFLSRCETSSATRTRPGTGYDSRID